jgi:AcrR family transcriptional regulator
MNNIATEVLATGDGGSSLHERAPRRRGRRRGDSGARDAVLTAAQRQFSELGYDRTTMRAVAAEAGVDQKLVAYFFGSKQRLFVAATGLPFDSGAVVPAILAGDRDTIGERLADSIVGVLEQPDAGPRLVGLVRAAAADPEAARMVRDLLTRELWEPAVALLQADQPELAVNLVATQILGLVMARYVIRAEPLASLPADELARSIAPTLQRHLVGDRERQVPEPRRRGRPRAER